MQSYLDLVGFGAQGWGPALLRGLLVTLQISFGAFLVGMLIGLGAASAADHLARADLYHHLECPQAERYDLERALLLSDDPAEQLRLGQRIEAIAVQKKALH